jgi:hypothetical protein
MGWASHGDYCGLTSSSAMSTSCPLTSCSIPTAASRYGRSPASSPISRAASHRMVNNGDNSLIRINPNGINNSSIDEPDYSGGSLQLNHNPRTYGNNYFDTLVFSMNSLGTPGRAPPPLLRSARRQLRYRRHQKPTITESKTILFRSAASPRIMQAALKLNF